MRSFASRFLVSLHSAILGENKEDNLLVAFLAEVDIEKSTVKDFFGASRVFIFLTTKLKARQIS